MKKNIALVCFIMLAFIIPCSSLEAARLYFKTEKSGYLKGETGFATFHLDSGKSTANAVYGAISFDPKLIEIGKINLDSSVLNLWIQKPVVSNEQGRISFEGVILNPGFKGDSGRLIGFNFKLKEAGNGVFGISKYGVFANDGRGTSLATTADVKKFSIAPERSFVKISSSTHPNQKLWYKATTARISWAPEKDIVQLAYSFDQKAGTDVSLKAVTKLRTVTQRNLKSGFWYAHVKARHKTFGWLPTVHYRIGVDNEAPVFSVVKTERLNETFLPVLHIAAEDRHSGIAGYEIWVNGAKIHETKDVAISNYRLKKFKSGSNRVEIKAFDKMKNVQVKKLAFTFKF